MPLMPWRAPSREAARARERAEEAGAAGEGAEEESVAAVGRTAGGMEAAASASVVAAAAAEAVGRREANQPAFEAAVRKLLSSLRESLTKGTMTKSEAADLTVRLARVSLWKVGSLLATHYRLLTTYY